MGTTGRRLGVMMAMASMALGLAACGQATMRVDFTTETAELPAGYQRDSGASYDAGRGYGWVAATTSAPVSNQGAGRERAASSDQRFDTFVHAQPNGQSLRWEKAVTNGTYLVTVAVGDASYINSSHYVQAESVVLINQFVPDRGTRFSQFTGAVTVNDGLLTLDPGRGTNTKFSFVEIAPASGPYVTSFDPEPQARNVKTTSSLTVNLSEAVDTSSLDTDAVRLRNQDGQIVPATYNSDAAGSLVSLTTAEPLADNQSYRIETTSALKTEAGRSFQSSATTFFTGSGGIPPFPGSFSRSSQPLDGGTSVVVGPDRKLYVGTGIGTINRWLLDEAGVPVGAPQVIDPFAQPYSRTITGLRFEPGSTAGNLRLWVSHGTLGDQDEPPNTGVISVLSGVDLAAKRDVIIGLPRSVRDHLNNGIDFGPDGRLYLAQGSNNGYGAPDAFWGNRSEEPLSAAILVADVLRPPLSLTTVDVRPSNYDAEAPGALVTRFASGVRNAFDLVWRDGKLYAPVNESAGGGTPASPDGTTPALTNLGAGDDFLAQPVLGSYHGHPNPSIDKYVLNGGNPTTGADRWEVPQYPSGTAPDPSWREPIHNFGPHRSANGIAHYRATAFNSALQGQLLVAEFSGGDDILNLTMSPDGNSVRIVQQLARDFFNPLDVTSDTLTGNVFVTEFGDSKTGQGGRVTTLVPVD